MARGFTATRIGFAIGVAAGCAVALAGCLQDGAYGADASTKALDSAADCALPREGCGCDGDQPPIACQPDESAPDAGVCREGTRYCRAGVFGACEDVRSFSRSDTRAQAALIAPTVTDAPCSDCDANCYRVRDEFDPSVGALVSGIATGLAYHTSGTGVTLVPRDGAIMEPSPPDRVPDGTLYLAIRGGERGSVNFTSALHPPQSDIYLLLDQSLTMDDDTVALRDRWSNGALLDSTIHCHGEDASLAEGGIAGALSCMIDSPRVGIGMFRDIPVPPYASDASKSASAQETEASSVVAYRHLVDQSSDLNRTKNALSALDDVAQSGTPDIAGSQIPALHAIATGKGMFMGLDRVSVPDAEDCPSGRFGYPCFRDSNSPIVVLITDAPMHNGPDSKRYPYNYQTLKRKRGTLPGQVSVSATNDNWQAPFLLTDDAGNNVGTFHGSTSGFGHDISASVAGCGASGNAPNAVFRFDVLGDGPTDESKSAVRISTYFSNFDNVISVFDHPPIQIEKEPVDPINELFESAHELGDVSERHVVVTSNTAGGGNYDMAADYQGSLFGAACGADTLARDAVFAFDVDGTSADVELEVQLDMGAAHGVLAMYEEGKGPLPRWPVRATPLAATGNSDASPANVYVIPSGDEDDYLSITGDTTSLGDDYDATELGGAMCDPDPSSMDAGFKIHVDGTRRLRFDTEGSAFDTVLSLHSMPPDGTSAGFVNCDDNGVMGSSASAIEQELSEGDYYLVLKGKRAGDQGEYVLTVRDVDAVQTVELACDASSGSGDPAVVTFTAKPGARYYALVKGDRPEDEGKFTLSVHDRGGDDPKRLACDAPNFFGWSRLDLDLARGSYYLVIKGDDAGDAGDYRLQVGGASGTLERFLVPSYKQTLDALHAGNIRVGSVVACQSGQACTDARGQAGLLASDTDGVVRTAANADDVPAQVVKAVQLMESFDTVRAELLFAPDANPGFTEVGVTALADPNNGCISDDGVEFRNCVPGATPTFALALSNPPLSPVPPSPQPFGAYRMTLHISAERNGGIVSAIDVPVLVAPSGIAPANTYRTGSYHQDIESRACNKEKNQRPSWERLTLRGDVRPDTSLSVYACSADTAEDLAMCDVGGNSSGYQRVARISAGAGAGIACTVATQDQDCPSGYCSPYTSVCNEIEGASCVLDNECPGTLVGRCRVGASFATLGKTCAVANAKLDPASALDDDNYRKYLRVRFDLESVGDRSRTPSLFSWETQYWCRNAE